MALIGDDWEAGYRLFVAENPELQQATKDRLQASLDEFTHLSSILALSCESPATIRGALAADERFRKLVEREREKKILALVENKILDAHFLPVVRVAEPLMTAPGYVILFRQILSMPGALLEPLRNGIGSLNGLTNPLKTQAQECLACPSEIVANVSSPHVEHVLQRFSNVFSRVGVADCSKRYRDWLAKTTCEALKK